MYTITLSNGKKLENLELNGNNFISVVPVDSAFLMAACPRLRSQTAAKRGHMPTWSF